MDIEGASAIVTGGASGIGEACARRLGALGARCVIVDLDEGLRVVGRMSVEEPESLRLGCDVELTIEPIDRDEQGREVVTWKFRPL